MVTMIRKLFKIKSNKKGFTLIELCIVIALTAIVASMTVLFTTIISRRVNQSNIHNEVITSISNMETGIKKWLTHYDNSDYRIEINNSARGIQSVLEAWDNKGTPDNTTDDVLAGRLYISDDGETLVCEGAQDFNVNYIQSMKFSKKISTTNGSKNMIIYCDIVYNDPTVNEENKSSNTRIMFSTHSGMKINF